MIDKEVYLKRYQKHRNSPPFDGSYELNAVDKEAAELATKHSEAVLRTAAVMAGLVNRDNWKKEKNK